MSEEINFELCDAIIACLAEHGDMEESELIECLATKGFIVESD